MPWIFWAMWSRSERQGNLSGPWMPNACSMSKASTSSSSIDVFSPPLTSIRKNRQPLAPRPPLRFRAAAARTSACAAVPLAAERPARARASCRWIQQTTRPTDPTNVVERAEHTKIALPLCVRERRENCVVPGPGIALRSHPPRTERMRPACRLRDPPEHARIADHLEPSLWNPPGYEDVLSNLRLLD
jgi:hypothetical protein